MERFIKRNIYIVSGSPRIQYGAVRNDMMKVALVYDRINKFGGAERVLLALHKLYPDAPLYTSVYDKRLTPWADHLDVRTSFLQNLPIPKNRHEYYPFLMGVAFETFNFDEYDLVVSVTHEFAKAIITKPKTRHICYCLNPVGYLWSGYEDYFSDKSKVFKSIALPLVKYLRWYDQIVAQRPDSYIAISKTVKGRIKKYYGRESVVVYPPVEPPKLDTKYKILDTGYFLVVSRLVPEKRIDIVIRAFNKTGQSLKIVGTGVEEKRLKNIAKKNIQFLGQLTDSELASYYSSTQAVIIPGVEDFNIVAVEAQSFGKPIIAYGMGGVTETVLEGKTGWLFDKQTDESLTELLKKVRLETISPNDCKINARKFSSTRFHEEFRRVVESR